MTFISNDKGHNKKTQKPAEIEDSPFEAFGPDVNHVHADVHVITACDGEQHYVWLATRKAKFYKVTEVYPGMTKRKTMLRKLEDESDLTFTAKKCDTIGKTLAYLKEMVFEDFEADDAAAPSAFADDEMT